MMISYFLGFLISLVFNFLFSFFNLINFSDLINYTGSIIGAFISIYGVYIQINSDRKKEIEGILSFLNDRINKSLKDDNLKKIRLFLTYSVISYDASSIPLEKNFTIFKTFEDIPFEIDFSKILHLKLGRDIIELHQQIKLINKNFRYLFENFEEKKNLLDRIEKEISDPEIKKSIETIKNKTTNLRRAATNFNQDISNDIRQTELLGEIKKVRDTEEDFSKVIYRNKLEENSKEFENTEKLLNFHSREREILEINTFEIFNKMESIKKELDNELKKLQKFL
ncbi:hypothetical protein [Fusobacterium gastrosuis]|uniref:hypothetical protein n=1 Tax=Fusobacterium gastrosuis TaxID=1755100 RepID=UPI0034599AE3